MDGLRKKHLLIEWHSFLKEAINCDIWGQPVEACNVYTRATNHIQNVVRDERITYFTIAEKKVISQIVACVEMRVHALQRSKKLEVITVDEINTAAQVLLAATQRKDLTVMEDNFAGVSHKSISQLLSRSAEAKTQAPDFSQTESPSVAKTAGSLLGPLAFTPGTSAVICHIKHIDIKGAAQFIKPRIALSVRDVAGNVIGPTQESPAATYFDDQVHFNVSIHLQNSMEDLPHGFSVFIEFKHYKPRKGKFSTHCWALLDEDEMIEGDKVLEIYKKPVDPARKKLQLLTTKPRYLHIKLTIKTL